MIWWLQIPTTHRGCWLGKGGAGLLAPCSPFLLFRDLASKEQS